MSDPDNTPELGITIYEKDPTQGPPCAMACPYGTLYRNYFSMPGRMPQTKHLQINTLDDLIERFVLGPLIEYKNGYIFPKSVQAAREIERIISHANTFREDALHP